MPRSRVIMVQSSFFQAETADLYLGGEMRQGTPTCPLGHSSGESLVRRLLGPRGLPGRSRELGGCGRLWHGYSLPLARDSFARGGGGGLPGSRDEEAQPGRQGSSLVTRASVACKQNLEDNGKRGKGEVPGTLLPPGLQIPVPLIGRRQQEKGRWWWWWGTLGSLESGLVPAAILEEGIQFRFPGDREHFPFLSQADPLPSPIC